MIPRDAYALRERVVVRMLAADEDERRELLDVCEARARSQGRHGTGVGRTGSACYMLAADSGQEAPTEVS